MEKLTPREDQIMRMFWEHGPMFVRELVALFPDPKPHFNTVSTLVRGLEAKGYVAHESFGSTYRYRAAVTVEEFGRGSLRGIVARFFNDSYLDAVSALVEEERISADELRRLVEQVERQSSR